MKTEILTRKLKELKILQKAVGAGKTGFAAGFDDWLRVELTYTSNAIEGNTLTRADTALLAEGRVD